MYRQKISTKISVVENKNKKKDKTCKCINKIKKTENKIK